MNFSIIFQDFPSVLPETKNQFGTLSVEEIESTIESEFISYHKIIVKKNKVKYTKKQL